MDKRHNRRSPAVCWKQMEELEMGKQCDYCTVSMQRAPDGAAAPQQIKATIVELLSSKAPETSLGCYF